jgi:carbonic anhydrase
LARIDAAGEVKMPPIATFHNFKKAATHVAPDTPLKPTRSSSGYEESWASNKVPSRRRFLMAGMESALAGVISTTGMELMNPRSALAQSVLTPDAALQELMDGNRRFAAGRLTAHDQDLEILRHKTIEKQEPYAALLSCADSRVPVELVFDQSLGHLFVTRVAGNVASPEVIASLEYGVAVLGAKVVLVMGHSNCGAVKATILSKEVPGQISSLYPYIQPAVDQAGSDAEKATKANAKIQAALLSEASTVISSYAKSGKLRVVAGYYDITKGIVELLT